MDKRKGGRFGSVQGTEGELESGESKGNEERELTKNHLKLTWSSGWETHFFCEERELSRAEGRRELWLEGKEEKGGKPRNRLPKISA